MRHETGHFKVADGLELFYQVWQPDSPPRATVVLVHGFSDHSGRYLNLVRDFVPRRFTVYAYDQRGHGQSPGRQGYVQRFDDLRRDLHTFLQLAQEREGRDRPLFLLGQSMGGLVVLDYGLHYPQMIDAVVATAPHLSDPPISRALTVLSRMLSRIYPSLTMNAGLDETALCRNPDVVQAYRNDPLVHGKGTARLATELAATVAATQAAAGEFRPPLLICHGTADRLTDPEASRRFFERVPHENKAYFAYEGGYHEGHNDIHRERVIIDIAHWLEAQIAIAAQHAENSEETHG